MSITLHWDNNERTILRLNFDGQWTAAQFDRALTLALDEVRAADRRLFLLGVIQPAQPTWSAESCGSPVTDWPANLTGAIFVYDPEVCQPLLDTLGSAATAEHPTPHLYCVRNLTSAYETLTIWHLQAELQRPIARPYDDL